MGAAAGDPGGGCMPVELISCQPSGDLPEAVGAVGE